LENSEEEVARMNIAWIRPLFILAGVYDGLLGIAFVFAPLAIFQWYGIEPPNHLAYVQFPALLLILFAGLFFQIAARPYANRHLIPYGIGLKASYCGTAFYYQRTEGIPEMWIPWAWADLAFLVAFVIAWYTLKRSGSKEETGSV
jgi:hypothetical protein